jgi:signal transduction histidine kinase
LAEVDETNIRNRSASVESADMTRSAPADPPDPGKSNAVISIRSYTAHETGRTTTRKRSRRAAQKISALGEMTGGIAHDFRNVLCVIASGLSVAERSSADPRKVDSALAAVRDGIERGMKMTNRLLAFARQQELVTGPEDVNTLLGKLNVFLKYGAGPGIRVVLDLAPDLPKCLVDPPQFNSAILNLVVNARDAMPGGGAIRISTALIAEEEHVKFVRLQVCDDGAGMPPEVTKRIFDPYFTTKGDSGTGLGVPQVNALMKQVGGYVTVDSRVGEGTAFNLFFPVHEAEIPVTADAWRQLDRWADEGGAIATAPPRCASRL